MQSTGVCKISVGLTGDCNFFTFLQKPPLWTTEPMQLTVHHRFNRCMYFPRSSSANAPTYITSVASVQPVLPKLPDGLQVNAPTYIKHPTPVNPVPSPLHR